MKNLKALALGLLLALATPLAAFAQCSGQAPATTYCGNPTGSIALPGWKALSGIPFPSIAGGTVVGNRGTSPATASALTNPILGIPGTSTGQIGFAGATSGTATIAAQAAAGTPTLSLPTSSGTFAVSASTPLALDAATGVVSINAPYATLTASNGGIVYSGATDLAILAGTATASQLLMSGASATPSWSTATYPASAAAGTILAAGALDVVTATATPTLGANGGTGGQITLSGATSGSAVIRVAAAAGTGTIFQLPATNGSSTNILATDGSGVTSWVAAGTGDVVGPGSSTDTAVARFSGTGGKTIQNSGVLIDGSNNVILPALVTVSTSNLAFSTVETGVNFSSGGRMYDQTSTQRTILQANGSRFEVLNEGGAAPIFRVDGSAASTATALGITTAAAAGGLALDVLSSGTNESMTINAKGTGTVTLNSTGTGNVIVGANLAPNGNNSKTLGTTVNAFSNAYIYSSIVFRNGGATIARDSVNMSFSGAAAYQFDTPLWVVGGNATTPGISVLGTVSTGFWMTGTTVGITTAGTTSLSVNTGEFYTPNTFTDTTGSAANVNVASNGRLRLSTSLSKHKDVKRDLSFEEAKMALEERSVVFVSKIDGDPKNEQLGFLAEDVAAKNDILAARSAEGKLTGVQYDRHSVAHNVILKEVLARQDRLQKEVDDLRAANDNRPRGKRKASRR